MHDGRHGDGHHGFAGTHLGVDDAGLFVAIEQQRGDGLDDVRLGGEGCAFETIHHPLAGAVGVAGIDRWIGAVEGVQQLVAEFVYEVGEADGQWCGRNLGECLGQIVHGAFPGGDEAGHARHPAGYVHTLRVG
ncbi:hypothetical protein D3C84_582650 [compost metagenome]